MKNMQEQAEKGDEEAETMRFVTLIVADRKHDAIKPILMECVMCLRVTMRSG